MNKNDSDNKQLEKSEDKGVPLMKPTFFDKNDSDNPKYVSLETMKLELEKKKNKRDEIIESKNKRFEFLVILGFAIGVLASASLNIKFANDMNFVSLIFSNFSIACVAVTPAIILSIKNNKKIKDIEKEIENLGKEVEEKNEIERNLEKDRIKSKVKSISSETRKLLSDISNNIDLKDTRRSFGMSYEEFLEVYENSNGFKDDDEIDKAIESLDIFVDEESVSEKSSTKRKEKK